MNDNELLEFAADFRDGILEGEPSNWMCFAICAPLETLLTMFGVDVQLISGYIIEDDYQIDHVWLKLPDGRILDPTADQFDKGYPPVYLGAKPAEWLIESEREYV